MDDGSKLRTNSGVQRQARISDAHAINQYWRHEPMTSASHVSAAIEFRTRPLLGAWIVGDSGHDRRRERDHDRC